jgi:hypothetical protein
VTRPRLQAGRRSTGATSRCLAGPLGAPIAARPSGVHDALRLRRGAEHLHRLGPRAVAEFLAEVGRECRYEAVILDRLDVWRALHLDMLAAVLGHFCGGREFPPVVSVVLVE